MTEFGLIAVGLLLGVILALVAVAAYLMFQAVSQQRTETRSAIRSVAAVIQRNTQTIDLLRTEVTRSLDRMDADRLHDASQHIQLGAKQLAVAVGQLSRLMYAQQGGNSGSGYDPSLGTFTTPAAQPAGYAQAFSIDDEALDDARMLAERQRWNREHAEREQLRPTGSQPSGAAGAAGPPSMLPLDDPFAGMTQEQRAKAVQDFFAARRGGHQNPAAESVVADMTARMTGSAEQEGLIAQPLPDLGEAFGLDERGDNGEGESATGTGLGELED